MKPINVDCFLNSVNTGSGSGKAPLIDQEFMINALLSFMDNPPDNFENLGPIGYWMKSLESGQPRPVDDFMLAYCGGGQI